MGYDGMNLARMMWLTTYAQNAYTIGQTAANQLIHRIEHPEDPVTEQILISGHLMEGITVQDIND
jgi:DNA-binding LacI/PurR family transcriptional regulator